MQRPILAAAIIMATLAPLHAEEGYASWYGSESGHRTANGEKFPSKELTCAHKTWPFGSRIQVTDLATSKTIICRLDDRGPYIKGRVIDLNPASAAAIGMRKRGIIRVKITIK